MFGQGIYRTLQALDRREELEARPSEQHQRADAVGMGNKSSGKRSRHRREEKRANRSLRLKRNPKRSSYKTPRPGDPVAEPPQSALSPGLGSAHPSMRYNLPYETAERIFGTPMSAEVLRELVQQFSWKEALFMLAHLAAIVANAGEGPLSERVRRLTVDPLLTITSPQEHLLRGRRFAQANRDRIVLAHEEVILYLEHLVLLEGAETENRPPDVQISLWLAGANSYLGQWSEPEDAPGSEFERLCAEMIRLTRFNNHPDLVREWVRTHHMFSVRPSNGPLSGEEELGATSAGGLRLGLF